MEENKSIYDQMENFNENLIANLQCGVITCDLDPENGISNTIYLSDGWAKITGYDMELLNKEMGGNPQSLIIPYDREKAIKEYIEQTSSGNSYQLEYRFRHRDGRIIWAMDRGIITNTKDGLNQNQSIITHIKENEEKLKLNEARFRIATKASNATVFEYDIDKNSFLHIENAEVIFHTSAQEVINQAEQVKQDKENVRLEDILCVWYHNDDIPILTHVNEMLLKNGSGECEVRVRQANSGYIWCKLHIAIVDYLEDKAIRAVGHLVNIEEQHKKTERLLLEAQSDALTGLYNKNAIKDLIEKALKTSLNISPALLVVDVDNFKGVNDQLCHLFGDAVLMDVSTKLKKLFRYDGIVGRIGGDEFVVLIKGNPTISEIQLRAQEVCNTFRHTYSGEKADYKISCSVGIAIATEDDSFDSVFRKADIALYQAKAKGKDQYTIFISGSTSIDFIGDVYTDKIEITDSGKLKIKERIFELLYGYVDFSGSINIILALLGELLDASRVYIFENTPDNKYSTNIYEWCALDVAPIISDMQKIPIQEIDYLSQFNSSGICKCWDIQSLPQHLREIYEKYGVKSTFQVAIMEDGIIRGLMGYDSMDKPIIQSSEQVDIMTFAAKVTGTFIIKKRADESVKLYNQNKMEALDSLPSAIYVIDAEYRLHYINNRVKSLVPSASLGDKCHELFMQSTVPCANCPARNCSTQPCSTEVYNASIDTWLIANASKIRWSGNEDMRLISCQVINQYKK